MTTPRSASYTPSLWGAKYHARREEEVFGAGAAGPGKALALDTLIPTPLGLRLLADIHPGDEVFGVDGKPAKVIAETDAQLDRPCFRLTIGDQVVIADAEHEWLVTGRPRTLTTREIAADPFLVSLPAAGVIDFGPPKPHQVDPYVLGVCLVAGQPKDRAKITGWDLELYNSLLKVGYTLEPHSYRVSKIRERGDLINALVPERNRRIPPDYLAGSFNQRMALVEGIMDGAGGEGPLVRDADLPFLDDFCALAASLGLGPRVVRRGKKGRFSTRYQVVIQHGHLRCSRFLNGNPHERRDKTKHAITSIEQHDSVPVKCIQVERGTYCITRQYIPTHNSMVLLTDPLEQVWCEHIRCQQSDIPESFPGDVKAAIEQNPLKWGYSEGWSLHLRRTLTRLGETIERAHRMFPLIDPDVDWNEKRSMFTFSSGFKYQFGHCKDRNDYTNYLGQQYSHIAFDELVEFNKKQYDFICSRNRSGDPVLRLMLKKRSMSNPKMADNKGEQIDLDDPGWVKRYFVDPAPEGNTILKKRITLKSGEVVYTRRLYLPATLYDNPDKDFIRQYEIELRSKPKHIQDAYLYGRWDSVIGSFFEHSWNPDIHVCRPFKIPQHWPIFRALDWGYVSEGCLGYYAQDPELDILYKFYEVVFKRKKVADFVKGVIRPFEEANKLWDPFRGSLVTGPADTQIWEERGETALPKIQEFIQNGVNWCYADKRSREDNAQRVHERLTGHENFTRPPKLILFANCKSTKQVLPGMQTHPHEPTQPAKGGFDHPYDETSYACAYAHGRILEPPDYKKVYAPPEDDEPRDQGRGSFGYWMG